MAEDENKVNPRRQGEPESERMTRVVKENSVWLDYRAKQPEERSEDRQMREAREAADLGGVWIQCQDTRCYRIGAPFKIDRIAPNFSPNTKIIARCDVCDSHSVRAHGEAWVLKIKTVGGSVVTVQAPREAPANILAAQKAPGTDWLPPTSDGVIKAEHLPPIAEYTEESARILNERNRDGRIAPK
jgi:hypothetical protein